MSNEEIIKRLVIYKEATISNPDVINDYIKEGYMLVESKELPDLEVPTKQGIRYDKRQRVKFVRYDKIKYEALVSKLIRNRYSLDEELAILRQRDKKLEEFETYNNYANECKAIARAFVNERTAFLKGENI